RGAVSGKATATSFARTRSALGGAGATLRSAGTASYRRPAFGRTRTTGAALGCARSAAETTTAATACAHIYAPDIALAHGSVPGGLHSTGLVDRAPVIDQNEGIRDPADGAVLVVEHCAPVARTAVIIVAPPILHRWEIHRFGVDELRALHDVVAAH